MSTLDDARGVVIKVGDRVRQATADGMAHFNVPAGALYANAGRVGIVTALGRTRVAVDFGRELRTGDPVVDRICADQVIVVKAAGGGAVS